MERIAKMYRCFCFNPRTREGATTASAVKQQKSVRFNPRTREGATRAPAACFVVRKSFNPRTREGATEFVPRFPKQSNGFNPRTREGATRAGQEPLPHIPVSIHAPVRVRRYFVFVKRARLAVSIHAPVRVRLCLQTQSPFYYMFQSTHP